jgi:CBS domain-containing protein
MLSIFVAHLVSKWMGPYAYDEQLIHFKGVPFLDAELPDELSGAGATARALCPSLAPEARLGCHASLQDLQRALCQQGVVNFPVLNDGVCCGFVTRSRLLEALQAQILGPDGDAAESTGGAVQAGHVMERALNIHRIMGMGEVDMSTPIPVWQLMDPAPYTLLGEMPAARFYPLFTKMGATAACIVSKEGAFCGILSRRDLIMATSHDARHIGGHGHGAHGGHGNGARGHGAHRSPSHGALAPNDVLVQMEGGADLYDDDEEGRRPARGYRAGGEHGAVPAAATAAPARGSLSRCCM